MSQRVIESIISIHVLTCVGALAVFPNNRSTHWLTTYKNRIPDREGPYAIQRIAYNDREYHQRQDVIVRRIKAKYAALFGLEEEVGPPIPRHYETFRDTDAMSRYFAGRHLTVLGDTTPVTEEEVEYAKQLAKRRWYENLFDLKFW